jgi:membrane protease YdiL (CAAX protease family)
MLRRLFLSPSEPRLRAGWRLLIQTILFILLAFCLGAAILIPYTFLGGKDLSGAPYMLASEVIELFAITISVFLARRLLDRRSIASLGLQLDWRLLLDLLAGIAITFVMMGLIYLGMYLMGWIRFEGFAWQNQPPLTALANFLLMLFIFILVGWNEELLSRGYHLQTLASGLNLAWGVILSSAVFGLLHIFNPNATWVSAVGILLAGLFLAYAYLRTRRLWLSIGLHIGWNLFEGVAFGFPVSGIAVYPLTRITVSGPALWTGGAFGPEAGLVVLPALLLGAALIYSYTRRTATDKHR